MANIFKPKRSNTPSSVPTTGDLADGELAINSADKIIYLRDGGSVVSVANYSTGTGSGESYWVQTDVGIHTLSNVGIGTTNPTVRLQIDGVLGFGTFLASGISATNIKIGNENTATSLTTGHSNVFMGSGVGKYTTEGTYNNFLGAYAGYYNTTGSQNNFFGDNAGFYSTSAQRNNFIGSGAGYQNTIGSYNNFIGYYAAELNTTGDYNNFFGTVAGQYNTTGSYNNFIGDSAGYYNTIGSYNNFLGVFAGGNTIGSYNNMVGRSSGQSNITGNDNLFFGNYTGISTSSSKKVIIGIGRTFDQLFDSPDTTKDTQFAVGVRTDANPSKYWLVGDENFNIGIGTTNPKVRLQIDGVLGFGTFNYGGTRTNIRIGDNTTGASITDGYDNIFMGIGAGNFTTTGNWNNFIARAAGELTTTGSGNNFFGFAGGYSNTTGKYNSFFGDSSGYYNTIGNNNAFFGSFAGLYNSTGNFNTFFGTYTGLSTSSSNRVIIGSGYQWSPTGLFDAPDTTKDTQFAVGIRTDANPSKYWLVGDENFNIGIGTTNPQFKLDVGGDINFTGTLNQNGSAFIASRWTSGTGDDIYRLNGNVGIGSTIPVTNLDVEGDASISGYLGVDGILYKKQTPIYFDENNLGLVQIVGSGNNLKFYNPVFGSGGDWIFDTYSNGEVVRITNSGNVGIGTTNPTSKLTVGGDGNFTGVVTAISYSGSGTNLTGIVTSITAGTGVSVDQSTGNVTITASATEHKILDDISGSFNGSITQFTITSSSTNFLNSEITSAARLLISVGGVVQQPDPTQTNGYYISGGTDISTDPIKINFVEAPKAGQAFFGVAYGLTVSPTSAFTTAEQSIAYSIVFGV